MHSLPPIESTFEYRRLIQLLDKLSPGRLEALGIMMSTIDEKRLTVSVKEFAEATGVSELTIRRWLEQKKLRGSKIGRQWLIPVKELERIADPE